MPSLNRCFDQVEQTDDDLGVVIEHDTMSGRMHAVVRVSRGDVGREDRQTSRYGSKWLHLMASAPNSEREQVIARHADSDLIPELLVKFDEIPPQIGLAALI